MCNVGACATPWRCCACSQMAMSAMSPLGRPGCFSSGCGSSALEEVLLHCTPALSLSVRSQVHGFWCAAIHAPAMTMQGTRSAHTWAFTQHNCNVLDVRFAFLRPKLQLPALGANARDVPCTVLIAEVEAPPSRPPRRVCRQALPQEVRHSERGTSCGQAASPGALQATRVKKGHAQCADQ